MFYNTIKTAAAFDTADQGNTLVKRIDDSADKIRTLFSEAKILPPEGLSPEFLREQIAEVQLKSIQAPDDVMFMAPGNNAPFTPMAGDADIFGMLNELISQLDKLKGFTELGVYHSSKVSRDFESTNADNFLNTFKGIATEVADIGAAAATAAGGGVPSVDVSSIVNTITDSLSTIVNHSSDDLRKSENSQLIAARSGPNGPEYLGIKYHYEYRLHEWTKCGVDKKKGHYAVEKAFFVSYNLSQFRSLYAKAFPEQKDYFITFYYGDKVLEGTGPVLTSEQVEGKIISALGGTVDDAIISVDDEGSESVFIKKKAKISIRESGISALLNSEFKNMTLKKTDFDGRTDYYSIKIQLTEAA